VELLGAKEKDRARNASTRFEAVRPPIVRRGARADPKVEPRKRHLPAHVRRGLVSSTRDSIKLIERDEVIKRDKVIKRDNLQKERDALEDENRELEEKNRELQEKALTKERDELRAKFGFEILEAKNRKRKEKSWRNV